MILKKVANRAVVHMDLDSFFVSVERLQQPELRNKPVIVGGSGDRGVVASCSYEARKFGVHSAMPVKLARRLCPDALVISGDHASYSRYSHMVTDIIRDRAPLFEKSSIDEFYLDVTGMDRFFGTYQWAQELRNTIIKESGLPISFGLSTSKMVAKVGTGEAKPNGHLYVESGKEAAFLAPLPVSKIPMAGKKTCQMLAEMGIKTVSTLREMPVEALEKVLGKNGVMLWQRAHGIDHAPVEPFNERKSISTEMTFHQDTIDVAMLRNLISSMVEKLAYKLRKEQKLTACVTVKIRYSNFDTVSRQQRIPYTSADHHLNKAAQELFEKLYSRRMLVRLVGVRFSHLVHGNYQIDLFSDTEKTVNLYNAMDKIRHKYGSDAVCKAVCHDFRRLRSFKHFNPFSKNLEED